LPSGGQSRTVEAGSPRGGRAAAQRGFRVALIEPQHPRSKMTKAIFVIACISMCAAAQDASAAIKFKRFPHCPEGLVSMKTCECHAGTSGKYHFCHAGHYCHADGACTE
jgi:hypothetical protein